MFSGSGTTLSVLHAFSHLMKSKFYLMKYLKAEKREMLGKINLYSNHSRPVSEICQSEKDEYHMISPICGIQEQNR